MKISRAAYCFCMVILSLCFAPLLLAQTETASLSGRITDPQGVVVPHAVIEAIESNTNIRTTTETNSDGLYYLPSLHPGNYRLVVSKEGFKQIIQAELVLHVQDVLTLNFALQLGSVNESVTVSGSAPLLDTENATVSTVVDRNFAENLPMNGRSFQTLIQLTPGVVMTTNNINDGGQFSVNGQRGSSNYWMVDGVSANVGIGGLEPGNGYSGALGAFSAAGGTNSLVSIDALEEFRIQTSTYAPEFGRTPGAQISIVTRSGANQFHGTLFEYLRNDVFDANDWFANADHLPKPAERQNDFGGTVGGPIIKNRTFFFFSYEGLRLRLPTVTQTNVPDLTARQNADPSIQPYLNVFPLPTPGAPDNLATGVAQFNASYSNKATLDAYSIRIDHQLNKKLTLFGRYNNSPSELVQRGGFGTSLNVLTTSPINLQTATFGATWTLPSAATNDFRFNYSRTNAQYIDSLDTLGGAVLLPSVPLPSPYTTQNANLYFAVLALGTDYAWQVGKFGHDLQRQINIVDTLAVQRGSHSLKFGVDFRRMSPVSDPPAYGQEDFFYSVPTAATTALDLSYVLAAGNVALLFRNLGLFAQDTWRIAPRLTLTYGLRWDVDFAPSPATGPGLAAVTGFNLNDLSNLALAPAGTPPFSTEYGNVAPRLGIAYQLSNNPVWASVVRGGFGVFDDLATSEVGNQAFSYAYPFGSLKLSTGVPLPVSSSIAAPLPVTAASVATSSEPLSAFDPNLKSPYTLQWNVAFEQSLGKAQSLTASYVGAVGRRLMGSAYVFSPSPSIATAILITNEASSDYNALQVQFQRRLSHGLQVLSSYTWSHSIDDGSAGSIYNYANAIVPTISPSANRGPSDFDIRNSFTMGLTYEIPSPKVNAFTDAILHGWSTENVIQAHSALPVNVYDSAFSALVNGLTAVRPDVTGKPFYIYGSTLPGGKGFNPAAFTAPPVDSSGNPLRGGNLSRNALRGFGATQWDFAAHRDFHIHESLKLQFRVELFNVLNHPNFAPPVADINSPQFGVSTQMVNNYLGSNLGNGGFSPLYQLGGPRSVQLALKLMF